MSSADPGGHTSGPTRPRLLSRLLSRAAPAIAPAHPRVLVNPEHTRELQAWRPRRPEMIRVALRAYWCRLHAGARARHLEYLSSPKNAFLLELEPYGVAILHLCDSHAPTPSNSKIHHARVLGSPARPGHARQHPGPGPPAARPGADGTPRLFCGLPMTLHPQEVAAADRHLWMSCAGARCSLADAPPLICLRLYDGSPPRSGRQENHGRRTAAPGQQLADCRRVDLRSCPADRGR